MTGMLEARRPQEAARATGSRRRRSAQLEPSEPSQDPAAGAVVERLAYTVEEAAAILGIGRDLIYDEIRTGRLRSKKAGARRIIGRHHLLEWLDIDQREPRRRAS